MISAIIFIAFVLFIEQLSGIGVRIGLFAVITAGAIFLYLHHWHRFTGTQRWMLLFLFIVPSLALLFRSFLKE